VAGHFPLYTDADVRGSLIKALKAAGWDVVRGIDALPEGANDLLHFERAATLGRVLVTNDADQEAIADKWYREGRAFPGVIAWRQRSYREMTVGEILKAFEEIATREQPFSPYPILRIKPKR
jgi:Domain of unknown function (DUF5615)